MDASNASEPWRHESATVLFDMVGDPRPGQGLLGVSDPDVHLIDGRWTMLLGGFTTRFVVRIVEARLPEGAHITDDRWQLVTDGRGKAVHRGASSHRAAWDYRGMHTPCFVRGETEKASVERIYYAGRASSQRTGRRSRYSIGMLERIGSNWARRDAPVIQGDDERPSALEPRVVFADGLWRIWYLSAIGEVGKGEQPDYEMRYAESKDGVDWGPPATFSTTDEGFFDNAVQPHDGHWEMILARGTNLYGTRPYPSQGMWWSESTTKPGPRRHWTPPVQFLDTDSEAESWFASGVCGPSFARSTAEDGRERIHVFATGTREPTSWTTAAAKRLRRRRRPPPPSPYYLAVGRFTFTSR